MAMAQIQSKGSNQNKQLDFFQTRRIRFRKQQETAGKKISETHLSEDYRKNLYECDEYQTIITDPDEDHICFDCGEILSVGQEIVYCCNSCSWTDGERTFFYCSSCVIPDKNDCDEKGFICVGCANDDTLEKSYRLIYLKDAIRNGKSFYVDGKVYEAKRKSPEETSCFGRREEEIPPFKKRKLSSSA